MNCRNIVPLLSAERDGVLTDKQRATLVRHVEGCATCQRMRAEIAYAMEAFRTDAINVTVPDANQEWRQLRARLATTPDKSQQRIKLAPFIWIGGSLAAAAAVAVSFIGLRPQDKTPAAPVAPVPEVAQAEYVEPGDAKASTMVYVDKDSGWLVVWATDPDATTKG